MATATPDPVNGKITFAWTNPVLQNNRIYSRLNSGSPWKLIRNVTGANGANSLDLYDVIPLGITQDYLITGVNATSGAESALSLILPGVAITPDIHWDLGGYDVMLHVVGSGATLKAPMLTRKPITITWNTDTETVLMFGNTAPSKRYGLGRWRQIEFTYLVKDAAQLAQLSAVIAAAMGTPNTTLCFRDLFGNIIYCGLDTTQVHTQDLYMEDQLKLVETQYVVNP